MKIPINMKSILNLHSPNKQKRIAYKNFFVRNIKQKNTFYMSFEDVGKIDDYVWKTYKTKEKQYEYWPFFDLLQTVYIVRGKRKIKVKFRTKKEEKEMSFPKELEKLYKKSLKEIKF